MQALLYDANGHDRSLTDDELATRPIADTCLLWLSLAPDETAAISLPAAISPALAAYDPAQPGVRLHDGFYQLNVPVNGETEADRLGMLVAANWLVTIGEGKAVDFADFIDHDVGETMKGKLSGTTLAAALLREHFARFHQHISAIDGEVDRVEERILRAREGRNMLQVLAVLRRKVSRLRHLVGGWRPAIHALTRPDFLPELGPDDRTHLRHLESAFERLTDETARVRDAVLGSFDLYTSRVAQDTNRLLRTLTYITIGVGLVGAMAGVFGMNFKARVFDTGEIGFHTATWIMAAILATTSLVALVTYRRP